jgi:cytochrome c peroxidase
VADSNMVGVGIGLQKGARNAPTVLNSMFNKRSVYNVLAQWRADGIRQTLKILSG